MKITLLGTGTPAPSLTRYGSGYLVEAGDDVIVFDHGPGAQQRLLEAGRLPTDVTHIFITHVHYDHLLDFPRLLLQRWDHGAGQIPEAKIFGPTPIAAITDGLIGPDGVFSADIDARTNHQASIDVFQARKGTLPRLPPRPEVTEVSPGDVIEGKGWTVRVGRAQHFEPYMLCLGYRIETAAGALTYSGDNGGVNDDLIALAKGSDVLIHMCHFPSGMEPTETYRRTSGSHLDVAETARRAEVGTLVLTHMIALMDQPGVMEKLLAEMREIFKGTIIVGRDLMKIPLKCEGAHRID